MKKSLHPDDLSLAQQNYIEVIAGLIEQKGRASTTDVAQRLGVRLPSVSESVKRLVGLGLAVRLSRFEIALTAAGAEIWRQLEGRHRALRRFMTDVMAMEQARADEMACRVEHCVDGDFAERLRRLAEFLARKYPDSADEMALYVGSAETGGPASRAACGGSGRQVLS